MSDTPTFELRNGWIYEPDKDGNYLPFFIHVREKDIHYEHEKIADKIIEDETTSTASGHIRPQCYAVFNEGEYRGYIDSYGNITLDIAAEYMHSKISDKKAILNLPFKIVKGAMIQATFVTFHDSYMNNYIKAVHVNESSDKGYFDTVTVQVEGNNPTPASVGRICVTIKGQIYLTT